MDSESPIPLTYAEPSTPGQIRWVLFKRIAAWAQIFVGCLLVAFGTLGVYVYVTYETTVRPQPLAAVISLLVIGTALICSALWTLGRIPKRLS